MAGNAEYLAQIQREWEAAQAAQAQGAGAWNPSMGEPAPPPEVNRTPLGPPPPSPVPLSTDIHAEMVSRAQQNPNASLYPVNNGFPRMTGDIGMPSQLAPPKPHRIEEETVVRGGGIAGGKHVDKRLVDKDASWLENLVGGVTGTAPTRQLDEALKEQAKKAEVAKAEANKPQIGPPPPPTNVKFAGTAKGASASGAAKPASGAGAGGSASASMRMSGGGAPPGEASNFDEPYYTAAAAADQMAQAEAQKAQTEGEAAKQRQLANDKAMADLDRINQDYDKISQQHFQRLEQLNKEVAEGKIDPERWWHNQGTGKQILYVLGAMLGGFSVGLRGGGQNATLDMVKKHIDDDIEAQRAKLESTKSAAQGEQGLLAEAYRRTHNMQEAVMLAKNAAYDSVDAQLKQMQAASNSSIALANGNMMRAQWDWKRQEQRAHDEELMKKLAESRYEAQLRAASRAARNNLSKAALDYSKSLEKINAPSILAALHRAKAHFGGGEGLNWLSQKFGWDPREAGRENLRNQQNVLNEYLRGLGRFSKQNAEQIKKLLEGGSAEDVQRAYDLIEEDVHARIRALGSGNEAGAAEYWKNMADSGGFDEMDEDDDVSGMQE